MATLAGTTYRSRGIALLRPLRRIRLGDVITHVILVTLTAICLLPVAWVMLSSFKGMQELYKYLPPRFWVYSPTLTNYRWILLKSPDIPRQMLNSTIVTLGSMILRTFVATLGGYAFARMRFRGRDVILLSIVVAMFIPRAGGLMAQYELLDKLRLRNSYMGLILSFASGQSIPLFIMRQTFLAVPSELEDAARIDGAGPFQIFWRIAAPLATGGMLVIAITTFVWVWGDFLFTYTMLDRPEMFTIAIGVARFSGHGATLAGEDVHGYGAECAGYTLSMLPVILVFILLQKWFVRGLSEGVLKM
jgi:ABC-type glycerol-3-phosphate transport system permease component